jgi:hypothetical protein
MEQSRGRQAARPHGRDRHDVASRLRAPRASLREGFFPRGRLNPMLRRLPLILTIAAGLGLLWYGPIPQWPGYHAFADQRSLGGIAHAGDVLSNAVFALVGLWGLWRLWPRRTHAALAAGWPGFVLFLFALLATAIGSAWYHLAPDNARLVFDRLPIALASAGLLGAVHAETHHGRHRGVLVAALAFVAVASVLGWYLTELRGHGDLRAYLFLQTLPALLVPLWQAIHRSPRGDRLAFAAAIGLFALARLAEVQDAPVFAALGVVSGHTVKHLLAGAAAACIVGRLIARARGVPGPSRPPAAPVHAGSASAAR